LESLEEFYKHKFQTPPKIKNQKNGLFDVFTIEENMKYNVKTPAYVRRDFYKILLFEGENIFHFGDESIPVSGKTLLFFNPNTPYTYETLAPGTKGYFCVFKEEFFKDSLRIHLTDLPCLNLFQNPSIHFQMIYLLKYIHFLSKLKMKWKGITAINMS